MSEFHDLAELALNREGQSWGNLGYWEASSDYSDACRALALKLGEQAGLDQQSNLFDAGFGCGDQLLLWFEHFRVVKLRGVNLSQSQTAYAKAKLAEAGFPEAAAGLVQADITETAAWQAALGGDSPSHVLALDCAYHFDSRVNFFNLAQHHLAPAGRLVLTDFMLADQHHRGSLAHWLLRWMLRSSHIAEANIVHRDGYEQQLEASGFSDIRIIDISDHVMPGLAGAIRAFRQAGTSAGSARKLGWSGLIKYRVTGRFLKWAYHRSILRYCLISATKPAGPLESIAPNPDY
ncbi:cyclopropane-fatty-acyl-phospholipid synthase family protein [Parasphingorhabdus sp.]|uniref:SAM-dependent methyltransferase n=1 Tax=Parasphingorhabdus sp. TaxID=2709688 RepID=UPI003593B952